MNFVKLIISIVSISIIENLVKNELTKIEMALFEIGLSILFGAWIIANGW